MPRLTLNSFEIQEGSIGQAPPPSVPGCWRDLTQTRHTYQSDAICASCGALIDSGIGLPRPTIDSVPWGTEPVSNCMTVADCAELLTLSKTSRPAGYENAHK
jgi:hypothetical protein